MEDEGIQKVTERLLGSVLISTKDGVPLHRLAKEYREVGVMFYFLTWNAFYRYGHLTGCECSIEPQTARKEVF